MKKDLAGCQRTSRSWVFFTCAADGTSKGEKKVEIERRRPRLNVWIFCWAQLSVMDKQDKQQDETPCGGWHLLVSRRRDSTDLERKGTRMTV